MDGDLFPTNNRPEVHPLAAMFPMLGEDDLAELAADIKANGQLHPIIRTVDGQTIVDGRNRLKACEMAGVEPVFDDRVRDEDEARALILSANITRRHLEKGQRAMGVALLYPETEKGGRGLKSVAVNAAVSAGFSSRRLNEARTILRDRNRQFEAAMTNGGGAPIDNVAGIMNGSVQFDSAYRDAIERERVQAMRADRLTKLRDRAPDLADQVERDELELSVAEAEVRRRHEAWREVRRSTFMDLHAALTQVAGFAASEERSKLAGWLDTEEVETDFRQYFPGGIPEVLEIASSFAAGTAAINLVLFSLEQRTKR